MAKKSIYSSVGRTKKNNAKTVAIVLAVVVAFLVGFIVWCAFAFSGDGSYKNTAYDVSMMKIQLEEKDAEISELREQIARLEEQKKQLEMKQLASSLLLPLPEATPDATPIPTSTPEPEASKEPNSDERTADIAE